MESNQKESPNKANVSEGNINSKQSMKKDESSKNEIMIELNQNSEENELKIELYPENVPIDKLEKELVSSVMPEDKLCDSLDKNKALAFPGSNVPILYGLYTAHCKHYPIRIKPDDIWLLIVQAFSNHVNANPEELRELFVDFAGKKTLRVVYLGKDIKDVDKKTLEDFSIQINEQMKKYLGNEIIQILTSDFSTTNYDSFIVSKLSIICIIILNLNTLNFFI